MNGNKNISKKTTWDEGRNFRLKEFFDFKNLSQEEFSSIMNYSQSNLNAILNNKRALGEKIINLYISENFPELNKNWLLTGEGEMLKREEEGEESNERKTPFQELQEKWERDDNYLIPLYDDVSTIGGNRDVELNPVTNPTEYINAGSWFGKTKLTAGIRHYGDSMVEYPSGCILAIKEIHDFRNVIPGQNYVIETDEIRVTKRIQLSSDTSIFMAYSSNTDTYPDGTLIHQPFPIEKETIRKILLVIGRIVKEHSSGAVIAI